MRAIQTAELTPTSLPSLTDQLHVYNGLDCCVTAEVFDAIHPQLDNMTAATYALSRDLQAPVLEMKLRGVLIDQEARANVIRNFSGRLAMLETNLNRILKEGLDVDINWRSPLQLQKLFYGVLGIPPIRKRGSITVDRDALEKLDAYFYAGPIVKHLLAMRDIAKKMGVLKTNIDSDGRIRTSYNIAGTDTGRFSSNLSDFGTGTNLQNIEDSLRRIFVADPGMKFAYIDLEQAESRAVGAIEWNLFGDGRYLDACESGDLHTTVCKLAWSGLPWTGSLAGDKAVAEAPFYRQHSYRHMSKVLGHGTNYNGQPFTMAKHTKLEASIIKDFQLKYFTAFPAHRQWHQRVAEVLHGDGFLISLFGRRRYFFDRRDDPATVRKAIAFDPQSTVGDLLNTGMLQVWRLDIAQLLLQVHDAILVQFPEDREDEIVPKLCETIKVPLVLGRGRQLLIPSEAKTGWNWASWGETNVDGLKKFSGFDSRRRSRVPNPDILDRLV